MVYVKSCHTDEKTHFKDFRRLPTTFELGFMIFVTCKTTFIWKRHINVVPTEQHFYERAWNKNVCAVIYTVHNRTCLYLLKCALSRKYFASRFYIIFMCTSTLRIRKKHFNYPQEAMSDTISILCFGRLSIGWMVPRSLFICRLITITWSILAELGDCSVGPGPLAWPHRWCGVRPWTRL